MEKRKEAAFSRREWSSYRNSHAPKVDLHTASSCGLRRRGFLGQRIERSMRVCYDVAEVEEHAYSHNAVGVQRIHA